MKHERFTYKNPDEIKAKAKELKVHLPFAENTGALWECHLEEPHGNRPYGRGGRSA